MSILRFFKTHSNRQDKTVLHPLRIMFYGGATVNDSNEINGRMELPRRRSQEGDAMTKTDEVRELLEQHCICTICEPKDKEILAIVEQLEQNLAEVTKHRNNYHTKLIDAIRERDEARRVLGNHKWCDDGYCRNCGNLPSRDHAADCEWLAAMGRKP